MIARDFILGLTLSLGLLAVTATALMVSSRPAMAQVSNCQAIATNIPGARLWRASTTAADYSVTITYVGHSTFRIEAPDGTTIATDFAGFAGDGDLPEVVTMNNAHSSHWTAYPDPEIAHVLRGWNPEGGKAEHFLTVGEVLIRNVATDRRSWGGGAVDSGNSIFIFEISGLCLGHLGHLHQELSDGQIAEIGRLDIVFVPIDGGFTMPHPQMMNVLERLRSSIAIPMHWFSQGNLTTFVARTREHGFGVDVKADPTVTLTLNDLPSTPTMMVLPRTHPF
ncbi:MAG: MBL fold metallo-hydrolase [Pseudomonadota bacterium]